MRPALAPEIETGYSQRGEISNASSSKTTAWSPAASNRTHPSRLYGRLAGSAESRSVPGGENFDLAIVASVSPRQTDCHSFEVCAVAAKHPRSSWVFPPVAAWKIPSAVSTSAPMTISKPLLPELIAESAR